MRFTWFWTFWHWSKDSFESGSLLRSPIHGIGGHWDEWFRHEASPAEVSAIEHTGRTSGDQRCFVRWLVRYWSREAHWRGTHPPVRFVLGQLAHLAPFDRWATFERYRATYGLGGISAIVLSEGSDGESTDVRMVEALALPLDADTTAPAIVSEEFEADGGTLAASREAAMSLLDGRGLMMLMVLWIAEGRRPYPRWASLTLVLGWLITAAMIVGLLVMPDPRGRLTAVVPMLVTLWAGLTLIGLTMAGRLTAQAWRLGRRWRRALEESQIRLRMHGGLRLQGGSAGLPFCVSILAALDRARAREGRDSWLWRRILGTLRRDAGAWAATGTISESGRVEPVFLEGKVRAILRQRTITDLLLPWQTDGDQRALDRVAARADSVRPTGTGPASFVDQRPVGFAAARRLRSHRCRHAAQALMAVGRLTSRRQLAANLLALAVTVVMIVAMPDWMSILRPPAAPAVIAPSSPSPYYLWVSLDTRRPRDFWVVLESDFWANRRAEVTRQGGANASVRAELRLNRLRRQATRDEEDGVVWVERRRRFLTRELAPGERVGRYDLSFVNRLGHE